jgi:hypothetical protein
MTLPYSEKQFAQQVVHLARIRGWRIYHPWNSMHSPAGFPDLCMVRLARVVFVELKSDKGKATPDQLAWLTDLDATGKVEAYLWRPVDWMAVEEILK